MITFFYMWIILWGQYSYNIILDKWVHNPFIFVKNPFVNRISLGSGNDVWAVIICVQFHNDDTRHPVAKGPHYSLIWRQANIVNKTCLQRIINKYNFDLKLINWKGPWDRREGAGFGQASKEENSCNLETLTMHWRLRSYLCAVFKCWTLTFSRIVIQTRRRQCTIGLQFLCWGPKVSLVNEDLK